MEGITILNQSIETFSTYFRTGGIVIGAIFGIIFLSIGIIFIKDEFLRDIKEDIAFITIGILFIAICIILYISPNNYWEYAEYKALIDDNVSFNYIMDNYDVGDIEGSIITLYEKNYDIRPDKR